MSRTIPKRSSQERNTADISDGVANPIQVPRWWTTSAGRVTGTSRRCESSGRSNSRESTTLVHADRLRVGEPREATADDIGHIVVDPHQLPEVGENDLRVEERRVLPLGVRIEHAAATGSPTTRATARSRRIARQGHPRVALGRRSGSCETQYVPFGPRPPAGRSTPASVWPDPGGGSSPGALARNGPAHPLIGDGAATAGDPATHDRERQQGGDGGEPKASRPHVIVPLFRLRSLRSRRNTNLDAASGRTSPLRTRTARTAGFSATSGRREAGGARAGTMSMIAPSCSTQPFGEPGVLQINAWPRTPARPRDNRPSGLTRRIASASPGASRSMTLAVPSGVWSRGAKPVPPVVTISPANPLLIRSSAAATASAPSPVTSTSTTSKPAAAS